LIIQWGFLLGKLMSGKGSGRRPAQVPEKQQEDNWNKIFGKKPQG
jgi:hypothetical protein